MPNENNPSEPLSESAAPQADAPISKAELERAIAVTQAQFEAADIEEDDDEESDEDFHQDIELDEDDEDLEDEDSAEDDDDDDIDEDDLDIEIEVEIDEDAKEMAEAMLAPAEEIDIPAIENFDELDFKSPVRRAIKAAGFSTPTPIQAQALPILMGDPTDFMGQAMTGTGKTAAFALPILQNIKPSKRALQALILTPTRELAIQISEHFERLGQFLEVDVLSIYGGADHGEQLRGLREGAPIAVATPGRLLEHIRRGTVNLDSLTTLVLDEADQMMSLGFREEVEAILAKRPPKRCRIWLFSATLSKEVRQMAERWLRSPKEVLLNAAKDLPVDLTQEFFATQESNKPEVLCKLLDTKQPYGLIFCQTKALASELTTYLAVRGYPVACLHGDKDQAAREAALTAFRNHDVELLVCTDVAARGLDIPEITHVINYSLPRESDVYLHRVGRTARSGKAGEVLNLISPTQRGQIKHLQDVLGTEIPEGLIPSRRELGSKKLAAMLARFEAKDPTRAMELLDDAWLDALGEISRKQIAGRFLALLMPEIFDYAPAGKQVLGKKPLGVDMDGDEDDEEFEKMIEAAQKRKAYQSVAPRTRMGDRQADKRLDIAREERTPRRTSDKTARELRRLDAVDESYTPPVESDRGISGSDIPKKRFVRVERFDAEGKPEKPSYERPPRPERPDREKYSRPREDDRGGGRRPDSGERRTRTWTDGGERQGGKADSWSDSRPARGGSSGYNKGGSSYGKSEGSGYSKGGSSGYSKGGGSGYGKSEGSGYSKGGSSGYSKGGGSSYGKSEGSGYNKGGGSAYSKGSGSSYGKSEGSGYNKGGGSSYGKSEGSGYSKGGSSGYSKGGGSGYGKSEGSRFGKNEGERFERGLSRGVGKSFSKGGRDDDRRSGGGYGGKGGGKSGGSGFGKSGGGKSFGKSPSRGGPKKHGR